MLKALQALALKDDDVLLSFGGAIKTLNEEGLIGGYLVEFSDPAVKSGAPDLSREFFTKETDYDCNDGDPCTVYYHHALDPTLRGTKLGVKGEDGRPRPGKMTFKDEGVWAEQQLDLADKWQLKIWNLAKAGKLGWSSGSLPHLVSYKSVGDFEQIMTWPLGKDASLTPTPCSFNNNRVVAMKTYLGDLEYLHAGEENELTFEAFKAMPEDDQIALYHESLDGDQRSIKAVWSTAYVNSLPDSAFAYVESGGKKDSDGKTLPRSLRHFPYKKSDGSADAAHVRNALSRIPQSKLAAGAKTSALKKIKAAAKQLGIGDATKNAEEYEAIKSLFSDALTKMTTPSSWQCFYALQDVLCKIRELSDAAGDTSVDVDIESMVDEALNDFEPLLRESILNSMKLDGATKSEPQSLGAKLKGYLTRLTVVKEVPQIADLVESKDNAFKSLFDEVLQEAETQVWNLWDALRRGCAKIAEAATSDVTMVTGTEIDVEAKVTELVEGFRDAVIPMIVKQINDYCEDPDSCNMNGEFYLKTQRSVEDLIAAAKSAEFDAHSEAVVTAVAEHLEETTKLAKALKTWLDRTDDKLQFRFVKDGRTISAASRSTLQKILDKHKAAAEELNVVGDYIQSLMKLSEPKVKTEIAATEYERFQQFERERLELEGV